MANDFCSVGRETERRVAVTQNATKTTAKSSEYSLLGLRKEKPNTTPLPKKPSFSNKTLWPPWIVARQAPLSMGFSRQEYFSGLPFLSPRDIPDPGIKPTSPTLQADSLPSEPSGKPNKTLGWSQPLSRSQFFLLSSHKEFWAPKNSCFPIVVLKKTLESPLNSKEIKPVNAKQN